MLTFSLNSSSLGDGYSRKVWEAILENERYFKKFNGVLYEEAMHKTFIFAIQHRKEGYSDLSPYIKKLARTILRVKEHELPYDVYNEDGEVSSTFSKMQDKIDETNLIELEEIKDIFREMYLIDRDEFMKLGSLFTENTSEDMLKQSVIKNPKLKNTLTQAYRLYGGNLIFNVLMSFFNDLAKTKSIDEPKIKEITMKKGNFGVLDKIPSTPCIRTIKDNEPYGIDRNTLKMEINPDIVKWDTVSVTNCNIIKVDIEPLINYIYESIFVEQGVDTKHITWCDNMFRLTTPGGYSVIGMDRNKFISYVHTELIVNLLMNNINKIIAISDDSVYVKSTRVSNLETIRLKLYHGKIIDLPVTVHIRKKTAY